MPFDIIQFAEDDEIKPDDLNRVQLNVSSAVESLEGNIQESLNKSRKISFLELEDTPSSYRGQVDRPLHVGPIEKGIVFKKRASAPAAEAEAPVPTATPARASLAFGSAFPEDPFVGMVFVFISAVADGLTQYLQNDDKGAVLQESAAVGDVAIFGLGANNPGFWIKQSFKLTLTS